MVGRIDGWAQWLGPLHEAHALPACIQSKVYATIHIFIAIVAYLPDADIQYKNTKRLRKAQHCGVTKGSPIAVFEGAFRPRLEAEVLQVGILCQLAHALNDLWVAPPARAFHVDMES